VDSFFSFTLGIGNAMWILMLIHLYLLSRVAVHDYKHLSSRWSIPRKLLLGQVAILISGLSLLGLYL